MTHIYKRRKPVSFITLIALIILVVAAPILTILLRPKTAEAAWFDDTYSYRLKITFTHNADITSERSVTYSLDTAELIAANLMQSDCDDTRFTDGNGKSLLYDLTGTCNNAATTYEVIFPSIVNGSNLAYVYYGNPGAANAEIVSTGYTALTPSGGDPSNTAPTATDEQGPAPISYWNFDENQGATANDYSTGSNNDLTITNAAWKTTDLCVFGNCLYFDGSTDYATKSYSADTELLPSTGSFTVTSWFKHTSTAGADTLISRADAVAGVGWKVYMDSSGYMCFGIDDTATSFPSDSACTTISYADSQWHYVTAVKSTTASITIYIDGVQIAQDAAITATTLDGTNAPFTVGNDFDNGTNGWDGFIDEVKYYNFAKTNQQVITEYASKSTPKGTAASFGAGSAQTSLSTGLVGYWKLDEASGNPADSSGNSYTLTNNGTTTFVAGKFASASNHNGTSQYFSTATTIGSVQTVAFWVNPASTTDDYINLVASTAYINSSSGTVSATGFTSPSIYVNGVLNGSITASVWNHVAITTTTAISATAFEAGRANGAYLDNTGKMDEIRLYNRVLSPAEIAALYAFAPGPVGWWKMDENTGTSANDSSGNDNTLTLSTASWNPGKFGAGWNGDGALWLSRADDADFDFTAAENFTVNMWFKSDSATNPGANEYLIDKEAGTGYGIYLTTGGLVTFGIDSDGTWTPADTAASTADVYDGTWHHLAAVKTGTTKIEMYVDGLLVGSDSTITATGDLSNADSLTVGDQDASNDGDEFFGDIDNVQIYRYARTAKQIVEDMNAGHPAGGSPISSAVIHWKFDEQQGATANNSGTDDTLDGTATGTTWRLENSTSGGCKLNGCINIDTATDDVTRSDPAFFDSLTGMTTSFWLNPQTLATTNAIVSKSNTSQETFLIQTDATNSDEIRVYIADTLTDTANYYTTNNADLTAAATYANWQHITVVYDATAAAADRVKVYKNGRLLSGSVTGTIPSDGLTASTANFQVGESHKATSGLLTYIDEVKIYNFALSPSEILVDANAGSAAALGGVLGTHDSEGFGGNPPIGWWKMDENTGTSANDSSGNGYTGTLNIGTSFKTGKIGSASYFDGTETADGDSHIRLPNDIFDAQTMGTISLWFKPDNTGDAGQVMFGVGEDDNGAESDALHVTYDRNNNTVIIYLKDNGTILLDAESVTAVNPNTWHYAAIVMSSAGNTMYIDGVKTSLTYSVGSSSTDVWFDNISENTTAYTIGCFDADASDPNDCSNTIFHYQGLIDDVRIYNYARTQAQIAYDYNRGAPVAHYKFDECQGTTAYNAAVNANGQAAGMNGTITPGALGNTSVGSCGSGTGTEMWNDGTTGKYNSALGFDGADDYITVTNADPIDQNVGLLNGLTASAWIYANNAGEGTGGRIFTKNTATWCRADTLSGSNLDIECSLDLTTDATLNVSTALTAGAWNHVVMTWTNDADDDITIWINGKNVGSSTNGVGDPSADTANLIIGNDSTSGAATFDGLIDQFQIYNYEMTSAQILRLFNEGSAVRFGPSQGSP